MTLSDTVKFIWRHPLGGPRGFLRFAAWQVGTRLSGIDTVVLDWVDGSKLLVGRGMEGATGNLYCGLHEYADMAFLLDVLRPGDLFVDVGANVGSYTVLAAGVCKADAVALEPSQKAFSTLLENIALNQLHDRVEAHRVAASAEAGTARFTVGLSSENHVVSDAVSSLSPTETIETETLDAILEGLSPTVIKIDVEGWELSVLQGATSTLRKDSLLACIMEFNSSSLVNYGREESEEILQIMESSGFVRRAYMPGSRKLVAPSALAKQNLVFVREDDHSVQRRCARAPSRTVLRRRLNGWPA